MIKNSLPIDSILPELCQELTEHGCLVLQAEPGAGKTTRVPLALLDQPWLAGQKILLLEPRRLAAMNAARFMSNSLGEKVGQTVGYTIRHERRVSKHTRIEVITEGVLTRRLQSDPTLAGVGLIIFDEFHERNLHSDLGLALSFDAQQGLRDDLKLLVMSATLDCDAVALLLGGCPVLHCAGRTFPVTTVYLGDGGFISGNRDNDVALGQQVTNAVVKALDEATGDVLVFLPGAREIKRCQRLLQERFPAAELLVAPLYGALNFEQQQHALQPCSRRKVVLATNIAETSLTIDGVGAVVDSGLERSLVFDPASGMDCLFTRRISAASAEQRAGRAGRVRAGHCFRLWSAAQHSALQPYTPAEISRCDLAQLVLELALWGVSSTEQLVWLDSPPQAHLQAATRLLTLLGALDTRGRLTARGRAMAALPLHPRLAAMVVSANSEQDKVLACEIAVMLDEADFMPPDQPQLSSDSDVVDRLEYWQRQRRTHSPQRAIERCERSLTQLLRRLSIKKCATVSCNAADVGGLLLAAFPDRVAQRRGDSRDHYRLRSGGGARLSSHSRLTNAPWLVAAQVQYHSGAQALIHLASALEPEQIVSHFAEQLPWHDDLFWDDDEQRVVARQCRRLGELIVARRPLRLDPQQALPLVLGYLRRAGLECLHFSSAGRQWLQRARFVSSHGGVADWPAFSDEQLLDCVDEWLAPWLQGVTSVANLRKVDMLEALRSRLNWQQQQQLEQLAPQRIKVPSGSNIAIDYSDCDQPVLAVKLQELFGWQDTPVIAAGRVKLTLHLLSPARRPLQVTRDLASFWTNTYSEVKKELLGRYPKHPWPDDPLHAAPRRGVKKRRDQV